VTRNLIPFRDAGLAPQRERGFTFIELMVIMGMIAVMMGITVGYLQGGGRSNAITIAKTQVRDACYRAKSRSQGGRLSTLVFRRGTDENGRDVDQLSIQVAETVLSHAFETLQGASRNLPMEGVVKLDPAGRTGAAARFGRGEFLRFPAQASFAVSEGLELEMWLKPEGGPSEMTLLEGEGAYEATLFRASTGNDYDVRLRLFLRAPDEKGEPAWTIFETEGAPVKTAPRWQHLRVTFDGIVPTVEVDGLERKLRSGRGGAAPAGGAGGAATAVLRRIAVPALGAVVLNVSSSGKPYVGWMDGLVLRGVFRVAEDEVTLPSGFEFDVRQPPRRQLPFRMRWSNGRLDPERHPEDVLVLVRDVGRPQDPPIVMEVGRAGLVRVDQGEAPSLPQSTPGASGAPARDNSASQDPGR
jgi:hypothetical protein